MQDFNTGILYNPSSDDMGINSATEVYKNSPVNPSSMWFKDYGVNGFPYLTDFEHTFSFVMPLASNYPLIYACTNRNTGFAPFNPPTPLGANTVYANTEQISLYFVGTTLYMESVVGLGGRVIVALGAFVAGTEYWMTIKWDVTTSPPTKLFIVEAYTDSGRGSLLYTNQLAHAATEDKRYIHTIGDYGNAGSGSLIVRDLDLGLAPPPVSNAIPPGMFGRGR